MIWTAIRFLWRGFLRLIVPPPAKPILPVIDPDASCPACGARCGYLECASNGNSINVRHNCSTCGAKWFDKTVYETITGQKPEVTV
jgi:hypothetical protein